MKLGYGRGWLEFEPPGDFDVIRPNELPPATGDEIEKSLDESVGIGLNKFSGCKSVSILVSDITRPAPSYLMLPPLENRLRRMGITDIKIIFALGTHRRMTSDEERLLLKDCTTMPYLQHNTKKCIYIGNTSRGTPIEIFDEVESSDLIIATGNIEYHYYAGYSGGAKAMLPGVSSDESIVRNHELMRDPRAVSGRLDSPVRKDMEEAAAIGGLDFILNVVLNGKKEIVRAVSGDFIQAHRAGASIVDQMYLRKVKPAEIVITCAGGIPKDINLFQAQKALDNAKAAAVPGGTIILIAECCEGLGNSVFERWADEAKSAADCIERFGREYEFGGHKAAFLAKESLNHDLILVSSISPSKVRKCFFAPAKTLNEAISMAQMRQGKNARMVVMPYGNMTLAAKK